jgi:chromosome segregation protein
MRLKSLEMTGFKSFSEGTALDFTAPVTAVVGPNGCGKSNIVDALRWVMGEQSARHLRGQQMEDVIFNGSENLLQTGMAEVSLTLDNEDGRGPVEYGNLSEIMVTRRLFRSGESEYFINKVPCRLKDITDLFLGTGVGNKAYSIVEQGRVEEIVNAKPEDRRLLIEEAAGTSKYKSRKLAAERKLERTQQNLLRVTDILREIERQIKSMELQAKKAERFKALREELKQKEIMLGGVQRGELEVAVANYASKLSAAENQVLHQVSRLRSQEAESESTKFLLLETEKEISSLQEEVFRQRMRIQAREQEIGFGAKDLAQLLEMGRKTETEVADMRARERALLLEIEELRKSRASFVQLSLFEEISLREQEKNLGELNLRIQSLQSEIDGDKENLIEVLNQLSRLRNDHRAKDNRREEIIRELAENASEQAKWKLSLDGWKQRGQDRKEALETFLAQENETRTAMSQLAERLGVESQLKGEREQAVEALRERLQESKSKWASLDALQRNYEGFQVGVRAIMLKHKEEEAFKGVCGLVADVIESSVDFEKALSAVLGDRLQYIIVQSHDEGIQAIDYLKRGSSGRGSFIPRNVSRWERRTLPLGEPEVIAPLLEKVSIKEGYRDVAEFLLGDVVVVRNLRAGLDLWRRNGFVNTLVTPEGEVIDPVGVVSGGSAASLEGSFLSQRRLMKELEILLASLEEQLQPEVKELRVVEEAIDHARERQSSLSQEQRRLELGRVRIEHEIQEAQRELARCEEALDLCRREESHLSQVLGSIAEELVAIMSSVDRELERKENQEQGLATKQEILGKLENELAQIGAQVTESRVRVAALGEKRENADLNLENYQKLQQELISQIQAREREILDFERRKGELEHFVQSTQSMLEEEKKELGKLGESLEKRRTAYREISQRLGVVEATMSELRAEVENSQEEKNHLQLVVSEKKLGLEHLLENFRERFGLEPEAASVPEANAEWVEELSNEIKDLRGRLERMGEVNLAAIGEFEELSGRYQFLNDQRQDLEKSVADLRQVIAKLNRICRLRFRESFEEINQKFQDVFARLFHGGKARLTLTDETDYLETGVEIVAQPPGKKLQSIILLSGGEKALTAISLLFGIFLNKPTPFCVLDEVDAPLDDANIDRFNGLVQELSPTSQFILITHNKRTMQSAQVLYGITMSEPGVSRVVSVRMH